MAPKLKLIASGAGEQPRPLQRAGADLWRRICRDFDTAEAMRDLIDHVGEGSISETGVVRSNPMVKDELQLRAFVAKTLERLGVNQEPTKAVGKPPGTWSHEPKTEKSSA